MARLLTLKAAYMMDTAGNKVARSEIAQIKVVAPNVALKVIDRAIQMHGGAGVSMISPWPICTPCSAHCVWQTARMKYTAPLSASMNWANICRQTGAQPVLSR